MIQLFIDNQEVLISQDQSIEVHIQNPLFTKSGEFSYNIDINLKALQNQRLFHHINRLNAMDIITERNACLVVDNRVVCQGQEVIIEMKENSVSIQIVGGNSEINYLGSKKRIKDLDLGAIQPITAEWALSTLSSNYKNMPGVCCPVMIQYNETPKANNVSLINKINSNTYDSQTFDTNTKFILQPYFLTILNKVFSALGWSIETNVLDTDDFANKLICIHAFDTLNFNEMIPNWTIDDFITEVEKFFNVVIVCNNINKSVSIYRVSDFYSQNSIRNYIDSQDILSLDFSPQIKFDQDDEVFINYENVKYDFPKESYYQYADIDDEILSACQTITVPDYLDLLTYPQATYNKPVLFYVQNYETYFIQNSNVRIDDYRIVQQFAHITQNTDSDDSVTFKICPAEVFGFELKPQYGDKQGVAAATLPYARNQIIPEESASEENGLHQWIQEGYPEGYDSSDNNLYLAYYAGLVKVANGSNPEDPTWFQQENSSYPQCVTYPFYKIHFDANSVGDANVAYIYFPIRDKNKTLDITFNLKYWFNNNYSKNEKINTKILYEINFIFKEIPDVTSIFNVSQRDFYCKELILKIENGHLPKYLTGSFYPAE